LLGCAIVHDVALGFGGTMQRVVSFLAGILLPAGMLLFAVGFASEAWAQRSRPLHPIRGTQASVSNSELARRVNARMPRIEQAIRNCDRAAFGKLDSELLSLQVTFTKKQADIPFFIDPAQVDWQPMEDLRRDLKAKFEENCRRRAAQDDLSVFRIGRRGQLEEVRPSGGTTAPAPQDNLSVFRIGRRGQLEEVPPSGGTTAPAPQDDLSVFRIGRRGELVATGGGVIQRNEMRQTSAGAFFNKVAEQHILRSRAHVNTAGGEFNLFAPRHDLATATPPGANRDGSGRRGSDGFQFLARYSEGKTSDSAAIAPGGPNTGFQFIDNFQGSGGITGVPGGQSVQLDVEMTIMDAMLLYWQEVARIGSTSIRAGVGGHVTRRNVKTNIAQQNLTFPGINSTTSTEATDTFVALRTAAQIIHQIAGTGLYVSVVASLAAGYLNRSGSAEQQFNCSLCAPPFNSVALSHSFSENGASVGATLGAMAGFAVSERAEVFIGFFNEWAHQSHVNVPATNGDPRANFTGNFLYSGRAKVGARVSLP